MKSALNSLSQSIASTGKWTWWAAKYPVAFQLEFDNTALYFGERDLPLKPSYKLALAFYKPASIAFLQKGALEKNWALKLRSDQIDGFDIDKAYCGFNQGKLFRELLFQSTTVECAFGCDPLSKAFRDAPIQFGFFAGQVGVLLAAESMRLYNLDGEIAMDDIAQYARNWNKIHNLIEA